MERQFNLIKNDLGKHEKRVLPRFPFCYLTFKSQNQVFEVKDISFSGMQMALKNGTLNYEMGDKISGAIHWIGKELNLEGKIMWVTEHRAGVEFIHNPSFDAKIQDFLSVKNISKSFKPLHKANIGLEIPARLKYWLRGDGPMEIFVWQHNDGELSKFQILLMEHFVEWEDGIGLKTGRALSKRNMDSPLITEDEYLFAIDDKNDQSKVNFALEVLQNIPAGHLNPEVIEFLKLKMN